MRAGVGLLSWGVIELGQNGAQGNGAGLGVGVRTGRVY